MLLPTNQSIKQSNNQIETNLISKTVKIMTINNKKLNSITKITQLCLCLCSKSSFSNKKQKNKSQRLNNENSYAYATPDT